MSHYRNRRATVAAWLAEKGVDAVLFEDTEERRSPSIRYLTGQPSDALCVILKSGKSYLVAWDVNMAREMADADEILSYTDFERRPTTAFAKILEREDVRPGAIVELPSNTTYPGFIEYAEALDKWDPVCRDDGADAFVLEMRAIKDRAEIETYRKVSAVTDALMDELEARIRSGEYATEADCALHIEKSLRQKGCEGTGFETLCAGPTRSFGIHCFPSWTAAPFATEGMSILDFGLKLDGYTSDVTMTFLKGNLSSEQAKMVSLVERATETIRATLKPGMKTRDLALAVSGIFGEAGLTMPHGLGHGIGLAAHEAPAMRTREDNEWTFKPGMVVAIEPGLYGLKEGGVRLENDYLITETGYETLTSSRIVRL